jgi:1-acyl-sn-glycerol-3-phosphate acyltransferase
MNLVYRVGRGIARAVGYGLYSYRVINRERLIEEGPAIIVSNHASFIDPPMIGCAFENELTYLARKSLVKGPISEYFYRKMNTVPVDQDRPDMTGIRGILREIKKGGRVLIFPEGGRTFDGELLPGQAGVGLLVSKSEVPVLPVRLFGAYEALPRGAKFLRPSRLTLVVGQPIDFTTLKLEGGAKEKYQAVSDKIMEEIAALKLPE